MTICDVFKVTGTDKHSTHHYCEYYERHLPPREATFRLLELGVEEGRSLLAWERLFPNAAIVGVDNDARYTAHKLNERWRDVYWPLDRAHVVIGDQADPKLKHYAPFDIVIDDASHEASRTRASFELLWPQVLPGGLYVIEDLETSYYPSGTHGRPYDGGAPRKPGTAVAMVKDLIDDLNHPYHKQGLSFAHRVKEIHLYRNIVFIKKEGNPLW